MNNCTFVGRLSKDPQFKYVQFNGEAKGVATFTLAVSHDYKGSNGEYGADFLLMEIWGKSAEYIANNIHKGDLISVTSKVKVERYKKNNSDDFNYVTKFIVEKFRVLSKVKTTEPSNQSVVAKSSKSSLTNRDDIFE